MRAKEELVIGLSVLAASVLFLLTQIAEAHQGGMRAVWRLKYG